MEIPKLMMKGSIKVYQFWTNFPEIGYEVLERNPNNSNYWFFETNIDHEHLTLIMLEAERKSFLSKLKVHYKGF